MQKTNSEVKIVNETYKVSVIVPVYNAGKYLSGTIQSILNQSYDNFELILVNDGSTDSSLDICCQYTDSRIKVISIQNSGPSAARNIALQEAIGDYIQFVDADDFIEPQMMETMVDLMRHSELAMCGHTARFKNRSIEKRTKSYEGSIEYLWRNYADLYENFHIQHLWNKMYRRDIIINNNIEFDKDVRRGEDTLFNINYFEHVKNISVTEAILYNYNRCNEKSITLTYNSNLFKEQQKLFFEIKRALKNTNHYDSNKVKLESLYIHRIMLSIKNLYYKECPLNRKEKIAEIEMMISDSEVKEILKHYKPKSWKHSIYKNLMQRKCIWGIYILNALVIRKRK